MDAGRRLTLPPSHRRASARSTDAPTELWHSTPVKKKNSGASLDTSQNSVQTSFKMDQFAKSNFIPAETSCHHTSLETEFPVSDPSGSTIQRQRKELQLLMAELKDRDRELNTMAASHQKQLLAWEQDRQRVLTLEQKCVRLDEELQKRNEVIRVLTKRVCVVETREEEVQKKLSVAQQQLAELEQKRQHISQKYRDFEEKNQSLNSTVMALSTQLGSLQVREEELSSMLKLKDKDVTEASSHILDLTERLRDLETSLTQSRSRENRLLRDLEENKLHYREARHEVTHLKEELQQHVAQSSTQREEMIRLKQELQLLHRDLALSGEGDSWKDELLELARSKQERTMSELRCLQQVCENQRNDLQLLQLNLDSARETLKEKTSQGLLDSQDQLTCSCLKNSGFVYDITTLRTACLQGSVNSNPGGLSVRLTDGDDPLSSCSLQQLLDGSRQVGIASPELSSLKPHSSGLTVNCRTAEPLYCNSCQTPHHHQSNPKYKASEAPPEVCPRHGPIQPQGGMNTELNRTV